MYFAAARPVEPVDTSGSGRNVTDDHSPRCAAFQWGHEVAGRQYITARSAEVLATVSSG